MIIIHCDTKTWGFITIKNFKQKECGNECCDMHKWIWIWLVFKYNIGFGMNREKIYARLKYAQNIGIKIMGI